MTRRGSLQLCLRHAGRISIEIQHFPQRNLQQNMVARLRLSKHFNTSGGNIKHHDSGGLTFHLSSSAQLIRSPRHSLIPNFTIIPSVKQHPNSQNPKIREVRSNSVTQDHDSTQDSQVYNKTVYVVKPIFVPVSAIEPRKLT